MRIERGLHRIVFLIGSIAIKVPHVQSKYGRIYSFVRGWHANLIEWARWSNPMYEEQHDHLCPIRWSLGGLIIVMVRATPLTEEDWDQMEGELDDDDRWYDRYDDVKAVNYGWLNQPNGSRKIVRLDYGGVF